MSRKERKKEKYPFLHLSQGFYVVSVIHLSAVTFTGNILKY